MRHVPLSPLAFALVGAATLTSCGSGDGRVPLTEGLPLADREIPAGETVLVSNGGDTLRLSASPAGRDRRVRLARYRRVETGIDSVVVVVDRRTRAPLRSFHRVHRSQGSSVTGSVAYGEGFEGQARLVLTTDEGRLSENLRTPAPALDAGQVPLTFTTLAFGSVDSMSINYIAPFEQRAVPARLIVAEPGTLRLAGETMETILVRLVVAGLEEAYWFERNPPHELVRMREVTRGITWTRAPVRP